MKKGVAALALVFLLSGCAAAKTKNNMTAVFFDVGQGDSALLITPENRKILVDCGEDRRAAGYLRQMNITMIDVLIITHPDIDHSGGCRFVEESVFVARKLTNSNVGRDFALYKGIEVIVAYDSHGRFRKDNDNSVVLKASLGKISFLFTGDCECGCEEELIRTANMDADVLKVGHHGSRYSSTGAFLAEVSPSAAVISVGENSYGHPHNETLERLKNAAVLRTDIDGTIIITTDGKEFSVK